MSIRNLKEIKIPFCHSCVFNFGDILTINILQDLFKIKIEEKKHLQADIFFIGSILENLISPVNSPLAKLKSYFKPPIYILGSGFIEAQKKKKERYYFRRIKVIGIRGEISKTRLEKNLGRKISAVIGDPGLLANRLITPQPKKYAVGIIPHYSDKHLPIVKHLLEKIPNSFLIDVENPDAIQTLTEISQCECILASAMHGLIVSDSLGVPNKRMVISDLLTGGNYKFEDYYSAYHLSKTPTFFDEKELLEKRADEIIESIKNEYKINPKEVKRISEDMFTTFTHFFKNT